MRRSDRSATAVLHFRPVHPAPTALRVAGDPTADATTDTAIDVTTDPTFDTADATTATPADEPAAKPAAKALRSGGPIASFLRFVLCGGGVGLASSAALLGLAGWMNVVVANAIVSVAGTLLANELHSRVTFRKGAASWRVHAESSGTAAIAYLFTTAAMLVLGAVAPHANALTAQAVYLAASGLAGLGRFVVLRLVVFGRTKVRRTAVTATATATVPATATELVIAA